MPMTKPGVTDCHWVAITMSPDATTAEFTEEQGEALDAAKINLMPTVSTYVAQVTHQGEHGVRGSSKHIAVHVEVTPEIRAAIRARFPTARGRKELQTALSQILMDAIENLGAPLGFDTEPTSVMAGRERVLPEALPPEDAHA